jgi:hypothetical protein
MDFERLLASLVAALAINELVHIGLETWGVRARIRAFKNTIIWHGLVFAAVTGLFFALFLRFEVSIQTLLYLTIFLMIVIFAYTTVVMDEYHVQIGKLLKKTNKD